MKLKFDYANDDKEGDRGHYRAAVPGLVAKVSSFEGAFPLLNISASGIAIATDNLENLRTGIEAIAEVESISQRRLLRCSVRLSRIDRANSILGFEFINLTSAQEASIDKLVLEIQKREIDREKGLLGTASK